MDRARAILNLEVAATETEFIEVLKNPRVTSLKTLSKEISVKISGSKAELIGRIVTYWERFFTIHGESGEEAVGTPPSSKQQSLEDIHSNVSLFRCLNNNYLSIYLRGDRISIASQILIWYTFTTISYIAGI